MSSPLTELVALGHRYNVERWPVEDDIGPLVRFVDLNLKAIEFCQSRIGERIGGHHDIFSFNQAALVVVGGTRSA